MSGATLGVVRLPHAADLPLPQYHSAAAAGLDLTAAVAPDAPLTIASGDWAAVPTGLVLALPDGTEGQVRPRSGLVAQLVVAPAVRVALSEQAEVTATARGAGGFGSTG
jgi:dUTP pyrophosphatase